MDRSYFVRLFGSIEEVDPHEKDFDAFLNSIRVPGEGGKPISWTVPAGWKEGPPNAARVVTIEKAGSAGPVHLRAVRGRPAPEREPLAG